MERVPPLDRPVAAAAHAFYNTGQQIFKVMRIDAIIANPNRIIW